jgi:probable rRNA maturation factor
VTDAGEGRRSVHYVRPWRIDALVRPGVTSVVPLAALARAVARALDAAGAPSPGSVGLIVSDDAELGALNAEHMGHEGPTDVLSFPLLPAAAFPPHRGQDRGVREEGAAQAVSVHRGRPHLGDIVVSAERALAQAEEGRGGQSGNVRWSPADEVRLLVTHGALHLCGWDHALPEEEAAMRALERELLGAAAQDGARARTGSTTAKSGAVPSS